MSTITTKSKKSKKTTTRPAAAAPPPAIADTIISIDELRELEAEVDALLHDARKQFDLLMQVAEDGFGFGDGVWAVSTPEERLMAANDARRFFVNALRGMRAASDALSTLRKEKQARFYGTKIGGAA